MGPEADKTPLLGQLTSSKPSLTLRKRLAQPSREPAKHRWGCLDRWTRGLVGSMARCRTTKVPTGDSSLLMGLPKQSQALEWQAVCWCLHQTWTRKWPVWIINPITRPVSFHRPLHKKFPQRTQLKNQFTDKLFTLRTEWNKNNQRPHQRTLQSPVINNYWQEWMLISTHEWIGSKCRLRITSWPITMLEVALQRGCKTLSLSKETTWQIAALWPLQPRETELVRPEEQAARRSKLWLRAIPQLQSRLSLPS